MYGYMETRHVSPFFCIASSAVIRLSCRHSNIVAKQHAWYLETPTYEGLDGLITIQVRMSAAAANQVFDKH